MRYFWLFIVVAGKLPLRKIPTRLGSGFGLGLVLELGLGGNVPRRNFPRIVHSESIFRFIEFFSHENCVSFCLLVSCLSLSQSA